MDAHARLLSAAAEERTRPRIPSTTTPTDAEQAPPDMKRLQWEDSLWEPLIKVLEGKPVVGNKTLWKELPNYHLDKEGILHYQTEDANVPRMIVPRAIIPQLIAEYHSHPMAGHYHARAVLNRLKRRFFWPSMSSDVRKYCDSCVKCHSTKQNHREKHAKLGTTPPAYGPWETVHTDIVGPLPETPEGHQWILLIVCAFSKFVELVPLKDTTAETVSQALVSTFFRYGLPFHLVSDNGVQYRAKLLAEINKLLGVRHIFISAYHSQANSNVERMCGVVKVMIATALDRTQREWHTFLGASQFAVNSTLQSSNKWSPAFLMFGRQFNLPIEQALSAAPTSHSMELEDLVTQLKERQFDAITQVIDNQKAARQYQQNWYNQKAKDKVFEVGDLVYLYRPITKPGNAAKLTKKWEPGYVVVGRHANGLTYDVRKPGSRKPAEKVHCDRLKPRPVSHVYRDAMTKVRAFQTARIPVDPETETDDSPDEEPDDSSEPEIPIPRQFRRREPAYQTDSDDYDSAESGVTGVLEALGTGSGHVSLSDAERTSAGDSPPRVGRNGAAADGGSDDRQSEDSGERYATIPARPEMTRQRPRRQRRPPDRYSP